MHLNEYRLKLSIGLVVPEKAFDILEANVENVDAVVDAWRLYIFIKK